MAIVSCSCVEHARVVCSQRAPLKRGHSERVSLPVADTNGVGSKVLLNQECRGVHNKKHLKLREWWACPPRLKHVSYVHT